MYKAKNMAEVIFHNRAAGYHFFDQQTMMFFGSRLESKLLENNTFVTSEELYGIAPRQFTVRRYDPTTARIKDVSGFRKYENLDDALAAAHAYKG